MTYQGNAMLKPLKVKGKYFFLCDEEYQEGGSQRY